MFDAMADESMEFSILESPVLQDNNFSCRYLKLKTERSRISVEILAQHPACATYVTS
jgi:hypothetical protein